MSLAVPLSTFFSRIRWQSDNPGTDRLTAADLAQEINNSWQALRELVSDGGHKLFLKETTGTLTAGALAGTSFGVLNMPSDCVSVYGIDVVVNGIRRPLANVEWQQRNEFFTVFGQTSGFPVGFHVYSMGEESTTSLTAGKIALMPAPDQPYAYSLWYLPTWTPIAAGNTTYVFNCLAGWDDWVVWDVTIKLAARDNDSAQTASLAMSERTKCEQRIVRRGNSIQRVGPAKRVDTAAIARRTQVTSRWRFP